MNKQEKSALDSIGSVLSLQLLSIESSLKAYDQITGANKKEEIEALISKFNLSIRNIVNKMNKPSTKSNQFNARQSITSPRLKNPVKKNPSTLNINSSYNRQYHSNNDNVFDSFSPKNREDDDMSYQKEINNFRLRRLFKRWKSLTASNSSNGEYISEELQEYINKFRNKDDSFVHQSSNDFNDINNTLNESNYDLDYEEYIKEYGDLEDLEQENVSNFYENNEENEEIFFASDGTPINDSNYLDFPGEAYFDNDADFGQEPQFSSTNHDVELSQPYNDDFFHEDPSISEIQIPNISSYYDVPSNTSSLGIKIPQQTTLSATSFIDSISPPSSSHIRPTMSSSQTLPRRVTRSNDNNENILLESLEKEMLPLYQKYLPK